MYMVIDTVPIADDYYYEIITENYLGTSSLKVRLWFKETSVVLTDYGFQNLCLLKPALNSMLKKISFRGTICYYFSDLIPYLAAVVLQRQYSTIYTNFVCLYCIETYNFKTDVTNWLHITKFHFHLLYKIRYQFMQRIEGVRSDRIKAIENNTRKTRPSVQSLAIACTTLQTRRTPH